MYEYLSRQCTYVFTLASTLAYMARRFVPLDVLFLDIMSPGVLCGQYIYVLSLVDFLGSCANYQNIRYLCNRVQ
jgi:hypothetical protein